MKKALMIGAGISGLTAARILAERGFQVTVLEKRGHIGGNVYDYYDHGVLVHKYGPHLFHTKLPEVAEFVQRFSEFFPYEHRVLGEIQGRLVPIPFNFQSIDLLYGQEDARHLKEVLTKEYPAGNSVPIMHLRQSGDCEVQKLAEFVYRNVFYGYTKKQWGKPPEELDASVMGRVPVRMSYDDRYFEDEYQLMPVHGYTKWLENIADHENIYLRFSCDALKHMQLKQGSVFFDGERFDGPVVYTGCIEDLAEGRFGRLPYRSLEFELEYRNAAQAQPVVQVNYPNAYKYTRVSEFKLVQPHAVSDKTILMYEYPIPCGEGDIPYYPVETLESRKLYERYRDVLSGIENLYLLGRLAEYQYYNMDTAVKRAMQLAGNL